MTNGIEERRVYAMILAAGSGRRMGSERPKQFRSLAGKPVLAHTLDAFESAPCVDCVAVVAKAEEVDRCQEEVVDRFGFEKVFSVVAGGKERQDSVSEGLKAVKDDAEMIVIHDGARPLIRPAQIEAVTAAGLQHGAAVLAVPVSSTIKSVESGCVKETLDRSRLWSVQTPQAFRAGVIRKAHDEAKRDDVRGTDDAALVERVGQPVRVIEGRRDNLKLTTHEDFEIAEQILRHRAGASAMRIGQGYDVHRLEAGRPLVLGGVGVPHDRGLAGYSDADVLCHAVADAILGALSLGDIGRHFPDTDPKYAGISSLKLLEQVAAMVKTAGSEIVNVDATVMAQRPKLSPHVPEMKARIASALGIGSARVSVKATTTEGLGFVGTEEGMAAQAVALLGAGEWGDRDPSAKTERVDHPSLSVNPTL